MQSNCVRSKLPATFRESQPRTRSDAQAKDSLDRIPAAARGGLADRAGRHHYGRGRFGEPVGLHRHPQSRYERTTENNEPNTPYHSDAPLTRCCAAMSEALRLKRRY